MHTDTATLRRCRRDRRLGPGPRGAGRLRPADARPGSTVATAPPSGRSNWTPNKLSFTIDHAAGANGLRAMVPITSSAGDLTSIKRGTTPIATSTQTIKGVQYAFFDAAAGGYEAFYGDQPPSAVNDQKSRRPRTPAPPRSTSAPTTPTPTAARRRSAPPPSPPTARSRVAADGSDLSYRPNPDYCNSAGPTDDFTYTLNGGSSATVALTVNCVDDPPHAVNDQKSLDEDSGGHRDRRPRQRHRPRRRPEDDQLRHPARPRHGHASPPTAPTSPTGPTPTTATAPGPPMTSPTP